MGTKVTARLIRYKDVASGEVYEFLSNNFRMKASTIAQLYQNRWQIELLFKRMKQNYPLKYFLGDSENAIQIQIWCSFGCSVIPHSKLIDHDWLNEFRGSSLNRKRNAKVPDKKQTKEPKEKQLRSLSAITKTKIRRKVRAFFRQFKKLSFLTLKFVNKVDDALALKMLGQFLDTIKKQDIDFQYLWVAERQTKNIIFEGNAHFHLIANKLQAPV